MAGQAKPESRKTGPAEPEVGLTREEVLSLLEGVVQDMDQRRKEEARRRAKKRRREDARKRQEARHNEAKHMRNDERSEPRFRRRREPKKRRRKWIAVLAGLLIAVPTAGLLSSNKATEAVPSTGGETPKGVGPEAHVAGGGVPRRMTYLEAVEAQATREEAERAERYRHLVAPVPERAEKVTTKEVTRIELFMQRMRDAVRALY